eukprot:scaffold41671_cov58-Phaeocystis_antarctica.AAC.3
MLWGGARPLSFRGGRPRPTHVSCMWDLRLCGRKCRFDLVLKLPFFRTFHVTVQERPPFTVDRRQLWEEEGQRRRLQVSAHAQDKAAQPRTVSRGVAL